MVCQNVFGFFLWVSNLLRRYSDLASFIVLFAKFLSGLAFFFFYLEGILIWLLFSMPYHGLSLTQ